MLSIINEPTAAAINYGYLTRKQDDKKQEKIFVFDMGGGTLDCTILEVDKTKARHEYKALSTTGNENLGGYNVDEIIANHIAAQIEEKHKLAVPIRESPKAWRLLLSSVEDKKKELSETESASFCVKDILGQKYDEEEDIDVTRGEVEQLEGFKLLEPKILEVIDIVLNNRQLTVDDISEVVLAGGSSRIPRIQKILKDKFNRELNHYGNPDEAIALGAALNAASMTKRLEGQAGIDIKDIIPFDLGIES